VKKVLALAVLLLAAATCRAQEPSPQPDLRTRLQKASVAVYIGQQICQWSKEEVSFFGLPFEEYVWGCKFHSKFICSATVVDQVNEHTFAGLSAGHCFDKPLDAKFDYYVADDIATHPVLHKINLVKHEDDDQYDYALFEFHSSRDYPSIPVNLESLPPIGKHVICVNFGEGVAKATVEGEVASAYLPQTDPKDKIVIGRYLVDLAVGPGASGSAIVDADTGEIVGLVEAIFPGSQMSAIAIETGDRLINFMDDDSVGLEKKGPDSPAPVDPVDVPKPEPTTQDLLSKIWNNILTWISDDLRNNN